MTDKFRTMPKITPMLVAVCLLLVSLMCISGITLASFTSAATGTDTVKIASFAVDAAKNTTDDLSINCNTGANTASCDFTVRNTKNGKTSEVDMQYSVLITLPSALPNGLSMTIDGISGTESTDGKVYAFTDSGWQFRAGTAATKTHTLTFTADPSVLDKNANFSNIGISVTAEQVN